MTGRAKGLPLACAGGALVIAACQGTPFPGTMGASPAPTASPTSVPTSAGSANATPTATPGKPAVTQTVFLHGNLYADGGVPLSGGQVTVHCAQYPQLDTTVEAEGGAYYLPNIPVGAVLQLQASSPGYGTRGRTYTAAYHVPDSPVDNNRVDFGGTIAPLFALSKYADIVSIDPPNGATGTAADGIHLSMTLSEPLTENGRQEFASLFRVQLPTSSGFQNLQVGMQYVDQTATLTWNASATVAKFDFGAPIAPGPAGTMTAIAAFDQTRTIADWPDASNGLPLGNASVFTTYDGAGAVVHNQIAPFQRDFTNQPIPSPSPDISALDAWGLSHATTSLFTITPSAAPAHVKSVVALASSGTTAARFVVTFDQPVQGYPKDNQDASVLDRDNYRFTLGSTDNANDARDFANSDPTSGGQSPSGSPSYATDRFDTVIVPLSSAGFGTNTRFKFYVEPAVKDIFGASVTSSVIEGNTP